jgi:hypothetical protein
VIAREWRDARWGLLICLAAILGIVFVAPRSFEKIQADNQRMIEGLQKDLASPDVGLLPPDVPAEVRAQERGHVEEARKYMREEIERRQRPGYLVMEAGWEIKGALMGANLVLVPLAGLLGVALVSGEVGRGTFCCFSQGP